MEAEGRNVSPHDHEGGFSIPLAEGWWDFHSHLFYKWPNQWESDHPPWAWKIPPGGGLLYHYSNLSKGVSFCFISGSLGDFLIDYFTNFETCQIALFPLNWLGNLILWHIIAPKGARSKGSKGWNSLKLRETRTFSTENREKSCHATSRKLKCL